MAKVFQYGSNCDTRRLNASRRLGGAAVPLGRAQTVCNFEIAFAVWSKQNNCAAADLIQRGNAPAWGVLYEIPEYLISGPRRADGRRTLARIEGLKYARRPILVIAGSQTHMATTFLVRASQRISGKAPSSKYVSHIVKGLRDHRIPEEYVDRVIQTALGSLDLSGQADVAERTLIEGLRRRESR